MSKEKGLSFLSAVCTAGRRAGSSRPALAPRLIPTPSALCGSHRPASFSLIFGGKHDDSRRVSKWQ